MGHQASSSSHPRPDTLRQSALAVLAALEAELTIWRFSMRSVGAAARQRVGAELAATLFRPGDVMRSLLAALLLVFITGLPVHAQGAPSSDEANYWRGALNRAPVVGES